MNGYLASFDQKAGAWPAFVSTAFPRFHDFYAQAGVGPSYGYLDDQGGNTLRETLSRAMTNASAIIQIATWNDFGEGTVIEPTVVGSEPTTEYGYTDLGIIQDFRRQYLDASFPYHTNDLSLAFRLYNLRKEYGNTSAVVSAELDRIFANIISGNLTAANLQLTGIESNAPVIYNLSLNGAQLQFTVGGYLSSSGIQIETTSDLSSAAWQTNSTLAVNTNQIVFSTIMSPQDASTFLRIRNNGP